MADAYLKIAQKVLSISRAPMKAKEIIEQAYLTEEVPEHLYGETQHKTLNARLSEDIIGYREKSLFFRTGPGEYFLREFIDDPDIPNDFKMEYLARRRTKDLGTDEKLYIHAQCFNDQPGEEIFLIVGDENYIDDPDKFSFLSHNEGGTDFLEVRSYLLVLKNRRILTFRQGKYNPKNSDIIGKRSIGFSENVSSTDIDLFSNNFMGIINCGAKVLEHDLGLPQDEVFKARFEGGLDLIGFLHSSKEESFANKVGAVLVYKCGEFFEPLKNRLAINDLRWMDIDTRPNSINDFEIWSKFLIETHLHGKFDFAN